MELPDTLSSGEQFTVNGYISQHCSLTQVPRIYLHTKNKDSDDMDDSTQQTTRSDERASESHGRTLGNRVPEDEPVLPVAATQEADISEFLQTLEAPDTPTIQFRLPVNIASNYDLTLLHDIPDIDVFIPPEELVLVIRRSLIVHDMLLAFNDQNILKRNITIRLVLPNGEVEAGEGVGVFADALTDFWEQFKKEMGGNSQMVPQLRHDYGVDTWQAVAKIIVSGYRATGYFPVFIARPFLEMCLFGNDVGGLELVDSFLHYVSPSESIVLKRAIENFDDERNDFDEILDILNGYDCKKIPTKLNFQTLIREISHKEIIQKSMFIVVCMREVFRKNLMLTHEELLKLYDDLKPSPRKIVSILTFPDDMNNLQVSVSTFLKRYIRSLDEKQQQKFLRFCTRSDLFNEAKIKVMFNQTPNGLARAPTGRTCAKILELPDSYESFTELRQEFDAILASNVWVMDVI